MTKILNRVGMLVSTTGQGTITAVVPVSNKFQTPAEAGAVDGEQYFWVLEEGDDFELFKGTWNDDDTISRDEVIASKIGGVAGTTKMTLAGGATLRSALPKEGVAQGWTLIESIAATSGTNKVFDNIPDAYSDLMVIGESIRLASDNSALRFEPSINNGSSYIETIEFTNPLSTSAQHYSIMVMGAQLSLPIIFLSNSTILVFNLSSGLIASRINAIRISIDQSSGARAFGGSGVLKLYGR